MGNNGWNDISTCPIAESKEDARYIIVWHVFQGAMVYMGNDGQPRVSMEIRQVKEIEYLSSRAEDEGDQEAPPPDDGFVPVDDEELPF